MRAVILVACLCLTLAGCDSWATVHVLTSEGRPVEAFDHPLSCQFAAFHQRERGLPDPSCVEMTQAALMRVTGGDALLKGDKQ